MDNERRYLLCTELPNSEWYLLSMMPFGTLDRILQDLSLDRQSATLLMCFIIIGGIVIIFMIYYKLDRQQMRELELA